MLLSLPPSLLPSIPGTKTSFSLQLRANPLARNHRYDLLPFVLPSMLPLKSLLSATTTEHLLVEEDKEDAVNGCFPGVGDPEEEDLLPAGLKPESMPRHVAVIMDGNRRWAQSKGLSVGSGYEAGVRTLRLVVELCSRWGIKVLTVFAFSMDNWFRPKVELEFLMSLLEKGLEEEMPSYSRENIRVSVIGDVCMLPVSLQESIINLQEATKNNLGLQLIVAVSYSGRNDIVQACQRISWMVKDGLIEPSDISESLIEQKLEMSCTEFPYPDLLIRTSGELRVSNFALWQIAYTEMYFSQSLWPDFGETEFVEALFAFQQRRRRYGG